MRSIEIVLKVFFIVLHLFQTAVSSSGGWPISGFIAMMLIGVHVFMARTFKENFHVSPWTVSIVGSVLWFIVAIAEEW